MALKIFEKFDPRANPIDGNYPTGSIKNESVPGANDGTPLDAEWGNDEQGFTDALLNDAEISHSGNADTLNASDRLDALKISANKSAQTPLTVAVVIADVKLKIGMVRILSDRANAFFDVVLKSGVTVNSVNIIGCNGAPLLALVRRESSNIKPKISFIFDDAWDSTLGDVKTLFDARGYKFAAAIPSGSLGNPNRLTINDIPKLQQSGFEVLNHNVTGDVANNAAYGQAKIRAEVQTCNSLLNGVGVQPVGFQAPSSVMTDEYLSEVSRTCPFAFTQASNQSNPIPRNTDPLKLFRFSTEAATVQECIDMVDTVIIEGGTVVFYAHDIVTSDINYDKIVAIMDRAEELIVVNIVPVSEGVKAVTEISQDLQPWFTGDLINNNPTNFSGSGDSSISVGNVSDITVTANIIQSTLVQKTFDLPSDITNGELITFSCALRSLSGTFGTGNSIGIQLKDVSNVVLYSDEISGGTLNTNYPRYNISAAQVNNAVKVTVFMRIDATSVGAQALMRNPVISKGNDVGPIFFDNSESDIYTVSGWPAQTFEGTPTASTTPVEFPVTANNGLFSVEVNSIVFQRKATVCIMNSVVASGTNIGNTWNGGWLTTSVNGGSSVAQAPLAGGANRLAAETAITLNVKAGTTLSYSVFADGEDVPLSVSNSRFSIIEM